MDTVSIRGLFTAEANKELDSLIKSKTMILNQQGKSTRVLGNDASLALYALTK